jgi:hypothetical protein
VLVHVRQTFVPRRLCERAVFHVELNRRKRYPVILHDDYLEAVREYALMDELLQFGSLSMCRLQTQRDSAEYGRNARWRRCSVHYFFHR